MSNDYHQVIKSKSFHCKYHLLNKNEMLILKFLKNL